MIDGVLDLSWWGYIVAALILTHITIASVTIYLHRHQAHRALDLHPAISHFFRFWLWLTTGMVTKEWTAIHRKHHAKCETPEDPHSPQVLGIRKVLWEGAELYRAEAKNQETLSRYGFGTPDDWLEQRLYASHSRAGIGLLFLLDLVLFGAAGITIWAVQMVWIPVFAAGVVNGIGHYWGYRNYETTDAATNIAPWGILIGGEELHNNHHAFPSSAKLSSKSWEFDIGWLYIQILAKLGFATVKKVAPTPHLVPGKQSIDLETVRAILINRLHVMAAYYRNVIIPVIKEESSKAAQLKDAAWMGLLRRSRVLLTRNDVLMDESARMSLTTVLDRSQALRTVYEYKVRLQEVWRQSRGSPEIVAALQDWCRQAEETGIRCLSEFSQSLRGYSLQPKAV